MRTCTKCSISKKESEFNWKNKNKKQRQKCCRKCTKAYKLTHYQNNKKDYLKKQKKNNIKTVERNQRFVFEDLCGRACVDCGNNDIRVLDYDHIDPSAKSFCIASAIFNHTCSLNRIQAEIDKCETRCANCHRIKTHPNGYRQRLLDLRSGRNEGQPKDQGSIV